jgi:ankyrin repeat protein
MSKHEDPDYKAIWKFISPVVTLFVLWLIYYMWISPSHTPIPSAYKRTLTAEVEKLNAPVTTYHELELQIFLEKKKISPYEFSVFNLDDVSDVNFQDENGKTLLLEFAQTNDYINVLLDTFYMADFLKKLVAKHVNLNQPDSAGKTPLFWVVNEGAIMDAACRKGLGNKSPFLGFFQKSLSFHLAVARQLLKWGAAVNYGDNHRMTPLMEAAFNNSVQFVNMLLDAGACMDQKNVVGQCASDMTTSTEIFSILLSHSMNNKNICH